MSDTQNLAVANDVAIDLARLDEWIGERLPGSGKPLEATRIGAGTGIANALFLLRRGDYSWVLRRPPAVKNDPSASDTAREWRILTALEGSDVPHPRPRLYCDEPEVLGAPFMLMDVVEGFTPGFELPPPFDQDRSIRRPLAMAYVEGCAALARFEWQEHGLGDLGRPQGFLERQVGRWLAQLDRYHTRTLPELDFLSGWLDANRPEMSSPGLLHGDYSPFNLMVRRELPVRLAAIVDWDTGTIGDPLLDIGHLLARWTDPGEDPVIGFQAGGIDGYPTRAEMAALYGSLTGRDLTALRYYEVLALFKLAVILEGGYARQSAAGVPESANTMADLVPRLLRGAAEFAHGRRN